MAIPLDRLAVEDSTTNKEVLRDYLTDNENTRFIADVTSLETTEQSSSLEDSLTSNISEDERVEAVNKLISDSRYASNVSSENAASIVKNVISDLDKVKSLVGGTIRTKVDASKVGVDCPSVTGPNTAVDKAIITAAAKINDCSPTPITDIRKEDKANNDDGCTLDMSAITGSLPSLSMNVGSGLSSSLFLKDMTSNFDFQNPLSDFSIDNPFTTGTSGFDNPFGDIDLGSFDDLLNDGTSGILDGLDFDGVGSIDFDIPSISDGLDLSSFDFNNPFEGMSIDSPSFDGDYNPFSGALDMSMPDFSMSASGLLDCPDGVVAGLLPTIPTAMTDRVKKMGSDLIGKSDLSTNKSPELAKDLIDKAIGKDDISSDNPVIQSVFNKVSKSKIPDFSTDAVSKVSIDNIRSISTKRLIA